MAESGLAVTLGQELATRAPANVAAAYLFGSFATGRSGDASDIDLALLYSTDEPSTLEARFGLEGALEAVFHRPVQVTILNRAPPDLIHRVLRDGLLLLDRDPGVRIRFEVAARNAFFDLQPYLRQYRRFAEAGDDR